MRRGRVARHPLFVGAFLCYANWNFLIRNHLPLAHPLSNQISAQISAHVRP
jgi:hypothetical protein